MKRTGRWLAFLSFVGCLVFIWGDRHDLVAQQREPTVTKMFTGPDGLTHFEEIKVPFDQLMKLDGGIMFSRSKPGNPNATGLAFHTAPYRRYLVTLSGAGEIVGSAGQKFIADPRHILLIDDLTGKGHTTRAVGTEDWVRLFLEIDEPRPRNTN